MRRDASVLRFLGHSRSSERGTGSIPEVFCRWAREFTEVPYWTGVPA